MNILVTGGAGFIGTNLIKRLIKEGHDVISVDNYSTGKTENHLDGCKYLNYDIRNINSYDSAVFFEDSPDAIFHLAATARIQPSFKDPKKYFTTNANGTLNIAEYCSKAGIPMIYAGSSSHHSGKYTNPYTFSQDIGEEIIKLYQDHFDLGASIARFYNVYGPYQLTEGGYTTLIGNWMKKLDEGKNCTIYGTGFKRRDFTHVDDIVEGLILMLQEKGIGKTFEFGRGKNHSINEVAKMFNTIPDYKEDKPGEAENTLADYTLAFNELGWEPKINLKDYINENRR